MTHFKIELVSNIIPICKTIPDSILRKLTIIEFKSDNDNNANNLKRLIKKT